MEERKEYNLIQSYLMNKYNISTAYRQGTDIYGTWYFETIIWGWDEKTKDRGDMVTIENSGRDVKTALISHYDLITEYSDKLDRIEQLKERGE